MSMLSAELDPDGPEVVSGGGIGGSQPAVGLFFSNAKCTVESISGHAVTICQVCSCGYIVLK